jgi:hypothetical protein
MMGLATGEGTAEKLEVLVLPYRCWAWSNDAPSQVAAHRVNQARSTSEGTAFLAGASGLVHPVMLIALTGWDWEEDRCRTQVAGFDCYFAEPAGLTALVGLLSRCPGWTQRVALL